MSLLYELVQGLILLYQQAKTTYHETQSVWIPGHRIPGISCTRTNVLSRGPLKNTNKIDYITSVYFI